MLLGKLGGSRFDWGMALLVSCPTGVSWRRAPKQGTLKRSRHSEHMCGAPEVQIVYVGSAVLPSLGWGLELEFSLWSVRDVWEVPRVRGGA